MNDTTIGLDEIGEELLTYEVSDEALETAAGTGRGPGTTRSGSAPAYRPAQPDQSIRLVLAS